MKKSLYLFSATLLVLVSCTNDYENSCIKKNDSNPKTDSIPNVNVGPILLKKLVHTYSNGQLSTVELMYNDNKIFTDRGESDLTLYTYTGDVITKIEKADLQGNIISSKEYVFVNGKVDYILSNELGNYYKTKFLYNSDGSIFYSKSNSDSSGNDGEDTEISGRYTFSGGNLITDQFYNGSFEMVTTYEYDSKNNPRLNILGYNLLIDSNQTFAVNNVIKKMVKINNVQSMIVNYSYEYDANGYPTKRIEMTQMGDKITTEISEYNY